MTMRWAGWVVAAALAASAPAFGQGTDVAHLADRLAIEDLMVRYAIAHNTTEPDMYRDIFADDAQMVGSDGTVVFDGIEEIVAGAVADRARFNPDAEEGVMTYGKMRHLITNRVVELDDGESATGSCYVLATAFNDEADRPEILAMARYEDTFVKRDGEWRISRRVIHVDWSNSDLYRILGL